VDGKAKTVSLLVHCSNKRNTTGNIIWKPATVYRQKKTKHEIKVHFLPSARRGAWSTSSWHF
jgi:hypothetical protein